jgi:hypothetical protein
LIALDTNILVYAHRKDSGWHAVAAPLLAKTAEEAAAWAIPWPCLHEFVGIVTRPRVFNRQRRLASASTRSPLGALRRPLL